MHTGDRAPPSSSHRRARSLGARGGGALVVGRRGVNYRALGNQSQSHTSAMSIEGAALVLTARARALPAHRVDVVNALALASRKPRATRTRIVVIGVVKVGAGR